LLLAGFVAWNDDASIEDCLFFMMFQAIQAVKNKFKSKIQIIPFHKFVNIRRIALFNRYFFRTILFKANILSTMLISLLPIESREIDLQVHYPIFLTIFVKLYHSSSSKSLSKKLLNIYTFFE